MEVHRRSELDSGSSRVYGYSLTIKQQIWCHYIIPGFSFLLFYVLNFSLDLSVGLQLINEHEKLYGSITIILLYLPALVCYLQQLYNPPSPQDGKTIVLWLCKEMGKLIVFPIRILKCLGVQLFWMVELIRGKEDYEHALKGLEESFDETAETYLLSQIFLHNIPQALIQFHMITVGTSRNDNTEVIQVICSLVSLAMAAQGITRLHRYESQRIGGRKPLWKPPTEQNLAQTYQDNLLENPLIPRPIPIPTGIQLPTRNPRTKALEEDNPIGKLLLFLYWFTFLFGRIITIITAMNFFPKIVITVISIHVFIMFLYYLWYPIKIHKKIFLTITSTFFLIEVGIRIKKIAYLYFLFIVSMLVEDVGLTLLWYIWGKWHSLSDDGWWFNYIVYVDINAHFLSLIFFSLYLTLFKPKVKYLPSENRSSNSARSSMVVQ